MEALRAAIGKTGAEAHQPQVATAAIGFFNCATPGFGPWVRYNDYRHKIDDLNLANMWPAGSTSKADLETADWISDGDRNNLIGGKLFAGAQSLHMFCAATTGAALNGAEEGVRRPLRNSFHVVKHQVAVVLQIEEATHSSRGIAGPDGPI